MASNKIKITLIKSLSGRLASHVACAKGVGLKKIHQSVEIEDNPCNRGMVNKISYMVKVEG
jgi:large subunit ribosomal protein L30